MEATRMLQAMHKHKKWSSQNSLIATYQSEERCCALKKVEEEAERVTEAVASWMSVERRIERWEVCVEKVAEQAERKTAKEQREQATDEFEEDAEKGVGWLDRLTKPKLC